MKTETVLPPLVIDATAQTERSNQKTESCQTEKSEGIDFEVQAELKTDTITTGTQTIKQENQEISMPNRPTSSSSKPSKKRKLASPPSIPIENTSANSPPSSSRPKPSDNRKLASTESESMNNIANASDNSPPIASLTGTLRTSCSDDD